MAGGRPDYPRPGLSSRGRGVTVADARVRIVATDGSGDRLANVDCAGCFGCDCRDPRASDGRAYKLNRCAGRRQHAATLLGALFSLVRPEGLVCCCRRYTPRGARGPVTLAEQWNGSGWAVRLTQNRPGAWSSQLSAVSCTSRDACVAVGDYRPGNGCGSYTGVCVARAIAENWDGSSWKLESVPQPSPSPSLTSSLAGVSCATAQFSAGTARAGARWRCQPESAR